MSQFLMLYPFFIRDRKILLDNLVDIVSDNIIMDITDLSDNKLENIPLYGDIAYRIEVNASILNNTIKFLKKSERCCSASMLRFSNMNNQVSPVLCYRITLCKIIVIIEKKN